MQEYVGPGACTRCHSEIAASQQKAPMFQAPQVARDSGVPQQVRDLKPLRADILPTAGTRSPDSPDDREDLYSGEFVALTP